jgi:hypothetical protein
MKLKMEQNEKQYLIDQNFIPQYYPNVEMRQ